MTASEPSLVEIRMSDVSPTMFGIPRWEPDGQYDVVFVGIPTDAGGLGHRSPSAAPSFLRTTSSLFPALLDGSGRAKGWFDYTTGQTLLAGVRMADAGNCICPRGAGMAGLASLPAVYNTLRETTRLLVILGGDHSIAYFLAQSLDQEGLVWVDAHEDASPEQGDYPDCANVVTYIDRVASVPVVTQFGLRGIVPADRSPPPAKRHLCSTPVEVLERLRSAAVSSVAVSIDVDVLDPSVMPAVGSAMPEGLKPADILALIEALCDGFDVSVLELAEFAPSSEHDVTSALVLVNLLLRTLHLCQGSDVPR